MKWWYYQLSTRPGTSKFVPRVRLSQNCLHGTNYHQEPGQVNLSRESGVEENVQGEKQDLEDKICPGSSDG